MQVPLLYDFVFHLMFSLIFHVFNLDLRLLIRNGRSFLLNLWNALKSWAIYFAIRMI